MENELEKKPTLIAETVPAFYLGDLDLETIEILVDDKIATGG
jgi:hypothetical protein